MLGLVPISVMLRLMFFSKDFGDKMVYPLIALFLGTGNQTAHVPSAIVERLFDDKTANNPCIFSGTLAGNRLRADYLCSNSIPNKPPYTFTATVSSK